MNIEVQVHRNTLEAVTFLFQSLMKPINISCLLVYIGVKLYWKIIEVDEPSPKKKGTCMRIYSTFSVKHETSHCNSKLFNACCL